MSLIPTVYSSLDAGAPILTGQAGSLAALLDAVLVDGYGSGLGAKASLGWLRAFSSGAKRSYRADPSRGATGFYVRIDDANAQYALASGFASMSDIDTGVDVFANISNAWSKSITANTTARQWRVVGNERTVYLFIENGHSVGFFTCYFFGDYTSIKPAYAFNFGISYTARATAGNIYGYSSVLSSTSTTAETTMGARSYDGATVGSALQTRSSVLAGMNQLGGVGGFTYPYPPTNGLLMSRVVLLASGLPFALFPGLWAPEHAKPLTRFTEYSGITGMPAGRFLVVESNATSSTGQGLLEVSSPWEY